MSTLSQIRSHFLQEADKDHARGLTHPTGWHVLASLACAVFMLAWGAWCLYLAWRSVQNGQLVLRGQVVTWAHNPFWFAGVVLGGVGLAAFSVDVAMQCAMEAVLRAQPWVQQKTQL